MTNRDPQDVRDEAREAAAKAERDRLRVEADEANIRWLMSGPQGRYHVWRLIRSCGVFADIYSQNAMVTQRELGRRSVGLGLRDLVIKLCPALYLTMEAENQ